MPEAERSRVFISYAHRDGAELACRLQADLTEKGFDTWLDKQRLRGGAVWTTEIVVALDAAEFVLALLTPGSYASQICVAEQLRSLRKGKCVVPLLAQGGTDIPLHLEAKNYRDFTTGKRYAKAFNELLGDLHARNGIELKKEFRQTYVTAPPLPVNYVERPEALAALRNSVITAGGGRQIALTALQGMGGIGKTVLAQALCHDEVVQQAFPDGVIWVTVGKESTVDVVTRMREVGKQLGDDLARYDNETGCRNQYRSTIRSKAALIVVDDVWRASDLEPLRAEGSPRSRLLFTTRDARIAAAVGAHEHVADLLTEEQSRDMLARWSGTDIAKLLPLADDMIRECGRLPLALSMVGAMLHDKPHGMWKRAYEHLRNADLEKIRAQFPDYPYTDVLRAIQVSVEALEATALERYLALAVLLEDTAAAPLVQQCLWHVDEGEALETAEQFVDLSLAQRDASSGGIRLHDLQLDYVRAQYADSGALELIHGAFRLSAHVIEKDPRQFASQLLGRLLPHRNAPAIQQFIDEIAAGAPMPWLRALRPTLTSPGGPLLRTLVGHAGKVSAIAVTLDGKLLVSGSDDGMLKAWEVATGREVRSIQGHRAQVYGIVITLDGKLLISGSDDGTLKVWNLVSWKEVCELKGKKSRIKTIGRGPGGSLWVTSWLSLTPDDKILIVATRGKTPQFWEIGSWREVGILKPGTIGVKPIAVMPNGARVVFGSGRQVKMYDLKSNEEILAFPKYPYPYQSLALAVAPDGKLLISGSDNGTLTTWESSSGKEVWSIKAHTGWVRTVAVTPDGMKAISGGDDKTLRVWNLETGREEFALEGHTSEVNAVTVAPDGKLAFSCSSDRTVKVWDLSSRRQSRLFQAHSDLVTAVAVTPDGKLAISASFDGTLKLWEVDTARELGLLGSHSHWVNRIRAVTVTPDGKFAISASDDQTLKVWEIASRREVESLQGHSAWVTAVTATLGLNSMISADHDGTLKLWNLATRGRVVWSLQGQRYSWPRQLAVTADGKLLISPSKDGTVKVRKLATGRALRSMRGHLAEVHAVAVTSDGRWVISASHDKTLKVWELESGREVRTLAGHTNCVPAVAVSPDGKEAVSVSHDCTLRVWDVSGGGLIAKFTSDAAMHACAVSPDGRTIVAGDELGRVHFLRLERV